jgi:hypothetical protein
VTRLQQLLTLTVALVALALPASALANPEAVIRDCGQDGTLDGKYSDGDLRKARSNLPTDLDEYSDCREIISAAIATGAGKGDAGKSGPSGGSANTPSLSEEAARIEDQKQLDEMADAREHPAEIEVGGRAVTPGSNGLFESASAENELPLPLLLALIGLGLLTLAGAFVALRPRVPLLARIPLPSRDQFRRPRR